MVANEYIVVISHATDNEYEKFIKHLQSSSMTTGVVTVPIREQTMLLVRHALERILRYSYRHYVNKVIKLLQQLHA